MHSISEEQFYYDGPEGDLVYETESELGIVEQRDKLFTVKIYMPQDVPWNEMAGLFSAEVAEIFSWSKAKEGMPGDTVKNPHFVAHNYESDKYLEDDERDKREPGNDASRRQYSRFYSTGKELKHWVMFQNDEEYLFVWQGELWEHLDDLIEDMKDNAYYIARFLQSWYDRVNGITKED